MATSDVKIVNIALTMLGEERILSLDDDIKAARDAKAVYDTVRDALFGAYTWSFAKTRTLLAADATAPVFGFARSFPMPVDCLRLVLVNEIYAGVDLTNYRGSPVQDFTIEGRNILTNYPAPLPVRYIRRVTETGLYIPSFDMALAAALAESLAEPLTQSNSKKEYAAAQLRMHIRNAVKANAIELPPEKLADDEWIMSRL